MESKLVRRAQLFDEPYWRCLSPDAHAKFQAPSCVVETIAPLSRFSLSSCLVVCSGGEIFELEGDLTTVTWKAQLVMPLHIGCDIRINHAAFDTVSKSLYVSAEVQPMSRLPAATIFSADLASAMESEINIQPMVILNPFFAKEEADLPWRVEGIAVEPTAKLIFACDERGQHIYIWHMNSAHLVDEKLFPLNGGTGVNVVERARPYGLVTLDKRSFHPFKCATMGVEGLSICQLAVTDYSNSAVYIFEVVEKEGSITATLLRTVATRGSSLGEVFSPRGVSFDCAGNLLVADYGNSRVQVFGPSSNPIRRKSQALISVAANRVALSRRSRLKSVIDSSGNSTSSSAPGSPAFARAIFSNCPDSWSDGEDSFSSAVAVWQSAKIPKVRSVAAVIDPESRQPIIIAGLYDAEEVVCYK